MKYLTIKYLIIKYLTIKYLIIKYLIRTLTVVDVRDRDWSAPAELASPVIRWPPSWKTATTLFYSKLFFKMGKSKTRSATGIHPRTIIFSSIY
jgi:hypothetical protein